jgi:hypothetical protein
MKTHHPVTARCASSAISIVALVLTALSSTPTIAATFTCTIEKMERTGSLSDWSSSDEKGQEIQVDTTDKGWRVTDSFYLKDNFASTNNTVPVVSSIDRETGEWWNVHIMMPDSTGTMVTGEVVQRGHCVPRKVHTKM